MHEALQKAPVTYLTPLWSEGHSVDFMTTEVRIAWCPSHLWIQAAMEDQDVYTQASADSQHLWQLGDVLEIFLEAEDSGNYIEMHVTPNNCRLHLQFGAGDIIAVREDRKSLSNFIVHPPRFESSVQKTSDGWSALVSIPSQEISPKGIISSGTSCRTSICRYDAWADGRPPVLSSTSPHAQLDFHRRHEWRPLCF